MLWKLLLVFIVSMIPVLELRGAIPLAIGLELGIPEWLILVITLIGNLLPIPFIFLFARRVLVWGRSTKWKPWRKFCNFCLVKGEKAGNKLQKNAKAGVYVALFLFVAVPLPGTGAWTGTLAASILNLDFKKSLIAVALGALVAGTIVLTASMGLLPFLKI